MCQVGAPPNMNCTELPSHTWRDPELVSVDLVRQLEKQADRPVGPRGCELWVAETRVPHLLPRLPPVSHQLLPRKPQMQV